MDFKEVIDLGSLMENEDALGTVAIAQTATKKPLFAMVTMAL